MNSIMISNLMKKEIFDLIASGKRLDGRELIQYRPIQIETGIIEKAEGSAKIKLGKTEVLVGVKIELGEPFSDTPGEGVLTVNSEFTPIASADFEAGRPGEEAIELSRVVDRGIRESKAINLEKLCIIPGKKVIIVFIDVYILNHDGNLIDASGLAALAALLNTRLFRHKVEDNQVILKPGFEDLPIVDLPVPVTLAVINGRIIADLTLYEEFVMEARLTVTFDKEGNICAMQKGKSGTLTQQQVLEAVELALLKSEELRKFAVKD